MPDHEEIDEDTRLADAVRSSQPSDWRYVAEGAANIVLASRCGPNSNGLERKALRLSKRPIKQDADPSSKANSSHFIDFQNRVIRRLFESENLVRFVPVNLKPEWIKMLNAAIRSSRPSPQCDESEIDERSALGLLMEDLTGELTEKREEVVMGFEIKVESALSLMHFGGSEIDSWA